MTLPHDPAVDSRRRYFQSRAIDTALGLMMSGLKIPQRCRSCRDQSFAERGGGSGKYISFSSSSSFLKKKVDLQVGADIFFF